jgi:hypothetical protein
VHDPGPVRGAKGGQHAEPDLRDPDGRKRPVTRDHVLERAGGDVLHDDPRITVGAQHVEDAYHVDVVEPGDRARLAQRPLPHLPALVVGQPRWRDKLLDRHLTVQHLVQGEPDAAHAALPERFDESIPVGDELRLSHRHHPKPYLCPVIATRAAVAHVT